MFKIIFLELAGRIFLTAPGCAPYSLVVESGIEWDVETAGCPGRGGIVPGNQSAHAGWQGSSVNTGQIRQALQDAAAGQVIVTVDQDRCLLLYPLPAWESIERQLIQLSSTHARARALKRLLLGHAEECGLDASGRILLPAPLREFANLDKRVVLVGQGNKFEIWDEQAWQAWRDALLADALLADGAGGAALPDLDALAF